MQTQSGNLIFDLQFGSTGKGLIAGYLAERDQPDTLITAWAANAGHTYIDGRGRKFIHTMLANGVVSPRLERIMIGPGSLINVDSLVLEISKAIEVLGRDHMDGFQLIIHPHAAVITQQHRDLEAAADGAMVKIGSTKKGCGAAMVQRICRNPDDNNVARGPGGVHPLIVNAGLDHCVTSVQGWHEHLARARCIQIEGAQGYSLSMYHGFYPYCTSRDVSVHQVLADCGVPRKLGASLNVVGTARTFPIRVANRYDEKGTQVGWSGPHYDDQHEISFEELGQPVELTTVTKLPRRIFTFSHKQLVEAIRLNGVDELFLNFANYVPPYHQSTFIRQVADTVKHERARLRYIGYGPAKHDIDEVPL